MAKNPIPEHVRAQADKAVAGIKEQVQAMPDKGVVAPPPAEREHAERAQQKIAQMAKENKDAMEISKAASKDEFGKA